MVHIFDRYDFPIFIDVGHVTPIGNQLIAEKILDVMHVNSIYQGQLLSEPKLSSHITWPERLRPERLRPERLR